MKFLSGITAALLLSAVNASTLIGRDPISEQVQTCVNDIQGTTPAFPAFIGNISAMNPGDEDTFMNGVMQVVPIQPPLEAAIASCCAITTKFTTEESVAVASAFASYASPLGDLLEVAIENKPGIDAVPQATFLWQHVADQFKIWTNQLTPCLILQTSPSDLASLKSSIDALSAEFDATATVYGTDV